MIKVVIVKVKIEMCQLCSANMTVWFICEAVKYFVLFFYHANPGLKSHLMVPVAVTHTERG